MSSNLKLVALVLAVIGIVSLFVILSNKRQTVYKPGVSSDQDKAVNQAKYWYEKAKLQGMDFSKGPCLADGLIPGWVADIAHNPRKDIDNLPDNQCKAFLEGRAQHFVELDLEGNVIRVK